MSTDIFGIRPSPPSNQQEPDTPSKDLSWDKEPANANVRTLSVASHGNSPTGRRHQLARAVADDNRAAPSLLSQDSPLLAPAPGSPPTLCTNLAALAQLGCTRPPGSTGLGCFRVCAKRRGGAPAPAAQSAPASRPQCAHRFLPAHCPSLPVPSLWAKPTWSVEQVRLWRPRLEGVKSHRKRLRALSALMIPGVGGPG